MSLSEKLPVQDKILDSPPNRLELGDIVIPENVDLTFVGSIHDARFSNIDYLESSLKDSDVLATEICGWTEPTVKTIRALAKGSLKDLQRITIAPLNHKGSGYTPAEVDSQKAWDDKYYKSIYGAKPSSATPLRIITPDYPISHTRVKSSTLDRAMGRFSASLWNGTEMPESDLQVLADREIFIALGVCKSIADLRKNDQRMKNKKPLKVFMPYGMMHYGVAESLQNKAIHQGNDTFTTNISFEPIQKQTENVSDEEFELVQDHTYRGMIVYQNWLRS